MFATAGLPPDQWDMGTINYDEMHPACFDPKARRIIAMFDHMYRQTPYAVAATLGHDLARVDVDATFEVTDHDVEGTGVPVRKGTIAGTAFTWTGIVDDRPFVTLTCRWVAALDLPGWEVDDDWMITIEGTPVAAGLLRQGVVLRRRRTDRRHSPGAQGRRISGLPVVDLGRSDRQRHPLRSRRPPGRLDPPIFAPSTHRRGSEPLSLR